MQYRYASQYADLVTQIEAIKEPTYNAAKLKENGQPFIDAAMAKSRAKYHTSEAI